MLNFGLRLKEEIEEAALTPEGLSQETGLSLKSIYNWSANISQPKLSGLIKLADYFLCSIDYLLDKEIKYKNAVFKKCPKFSEQLKKYMKESNIKPTALGRKIEKDRKQIYRWQEDKAEPQLDSLIKLADYFGVTIDVLIGRQ